MLKRLTSLRLRTGCRGLPGIALRAAKRMRSRNLAATAAAFASMSCSMYNVFTPSVCAVLFIIMHKTLYSTKLLRSRSLSLSISSAS